MGRGPRRWVGTAALLALGAAAALYALSTPRYALYRLGQAMQRHDVAAAERYFDVESIAEHATDVIVTDYMARQPAPTTAADVFGRQIAANMAKRRVRPQVTTRVRAEIRRSVERAGIQAAAFVLPIGALAVFQAFEVSRDGPDAWVTYHDPQQGPIRFRMSRGDGSAWRVTELDPEWVRRRAREEPARVR